MPVDHHPIHDMKESTPYVTQDGEDIPTMTLHRFDCRCGWRGAVWYASEERARKSYDRHAQRATYVQDIRGTR